MTAASGWGWLILAVAVGLMAGFLFGTQPSVNGQLSRQLQHPFQASIVSFASGTLILVVFSIFAGVFPPRFSGNVSDLPWWSWGGGAIGVLLVTASLIFVPRIGSLPWHATIITGQLVAALVLDHFGWLGNAHEKMTVTRAFGAVFLITGVVFIFWAKTSSATQDNRSSTSTMPSVTSSDIK